MQQTEKPVAKKQRVPNAERSAKTREKLIEATINCLYELGYHQTTTVVVAKRAGVSRGAMLHQFPSKADLMIETAHRLRDMRAATHHEALGHLADPREKFMKLIDVLWKVMISPSGLARLDLMLGARSDPELADRMNELNDELDIFHKARIWSQAEAMGIHPKYKDKIEAFTQLYGAATRGLAMDAFRPKSREGAEKSIALLKEMQLDFLEKLFSDTDT